MTFLRLERISKLYGDVAAVADLDLTVERGEFVSLLGPSGCGKTTTLQMVAGFVPASTGRIVLDGQDLTRVKPNRRGLGVVFQSYALFPHMTVADNVAFGLEMRGIARPERAKRVEEALALVHLDHLAGRYPRALSGGQRQRVALARALVIEPPVLLLDEPLSNLDAKLRDAMQFELRQIQRRTGTTTIMVTHDQAEALSISDRVVVMERGRITQIDQPYRMYEHPRSRFISDFVGKANLLDGVVAQPGAVARVTVGAATLEVPGDGLPAGARVLLCLRPEKLALGAPGTGRLPGAVSRRYFLGSQWLYHLDSPAGELLVAAPNLGAEPLAEGAAAGIDWAPEMVRVLRDADAAEGVR
ncbi:ABC transporter ATP-binding protein [Inquilinus sp.]|uniref:ABC transporter ATP-binding protein n=1 Tax=Inquilinus sp. TaxID=1932117 RepID=UPI0031D8D01C